jgi:chondroitin AC lyase
MKPAIRLFIPLLTIALLSISTFVKADDFELIKGRVVDQLMGSGVNDESIAGIIDLMNEDGSFHGINYDDLSREAGFPHGRHTSNLYSLARAYQTESSAVLQKRNH